MNKKKALITFSIAIFMVTGLLSIRGQDKKVELKNKRITLQMEKKQLSSVFIRLLYYYDVPIGFEESKLDKDHNDYRFQSNVPPDEERWKYNINKPLAEYKDIEDHLITLNFKDARLEDVMDEIVRQMQNYDWEINNDVVNIFPIKGRDPRFEKLLNLRIRGFIVPKGSRVGLAQTTILFYVPEFKAFLDENNLYTHSLRDDVLYINRPLPMDLEFSDLTLKELLNEITKAKRGGWILRTDKKNDGEKPDGKEGIELLL